MMRLSRFFGFPVCATAKARFHWKRAFAHALPETLNLGIPEAPRRPGLLNRSRVNAKHAGHDDERGGADNAGGA
jgi:hypothetical protein